MAKGYERHVQLSWKAVGGEQVTQYAIYRSLNGGPYTQVGVQRPNLHRAMDNIGDPDAHAAYKVAARTSAMRKSAMSNQVSADTHPMNDDELLTTVQEAPTHPLPASLYYTGWAARASRSATTQTQRGLRQQDGVREFVIEKLLQSALLSRHPGVY